MELKTESGVSITIIEEGSSRVLIFDKSVRAVELNEEEATKIKTLLSSNSDTKYNTTNKKASKSQQSKTTASEGL